MTLTQCTGRAHRQLKRSHFSENTNLPGLVQIVSLYLQDTQINEQREQEKS
jgi:hypothetical protein